MTHTGKTTANNPNVALFVTCLINQFRPSAGFSAIALLEQAGCDVTVPQKQTCCGQPGYNNGLQQQAINTAKSTIKLLEHYDYVVIPSGSCTGMFTKHYPLLLANDRAWNKRATLLANKTWELCQFLVEVRDCQLSAHTHFDGKTITYQDSCSCKRELKNISAPRQLLQQACKGSTFAELKEPETCCGFGGTFSMKYSEISTRLVADKTSDIRQTNADVLVSADLGCLINIGGYAAKQKPSETKPTLEVRHIAEVLANQLTAPSMAEPPSSLNVPIEV